jgi:lipopolysaccharide/colanic/teichoic acid biosynthesis glycosyltransferase
MIRVLDLCFSFFGLVVATPVLLIIYIISYFDTGSPIFKQERIGKNKKPFILFKFRTMSVGTASVASHLSSADAITKLGGFLRRTKLDELPQLYNVFIGDMSLVGPRPGLHNQYELTKARDTLNVYKVRPGITGLAQVSNIDMSTPDLLAQTDAQMIIEMSLVHYFIYIFKTITGSGTGDRLGS